MNNKLMKISILLILISNFCYAGQSIKEEIIDRCRKQMGEYGSTMVKACVDQDIDAVISLNKFVETKKYDSIISRCMSQMQEYGYTMVKACAEQDIQAEKALSNY
jgi:hypothetical protein